MHRLAFSVHEFLFSVELIKMCLQVKLGVYCSERLWESVPFSPLALCITSLSPSNDFLSPALLLVFHPVQALSSFPFSSKDKPIFHFLFCLMCSPISLKWQGRFMEFEVWALFAFFFFFFFWQDDKKIIYTWGIDTCWEWCGYKLPGILRNAERMSCATIFWYHLLFSPLTSAHSHRFQQVSTETVFTCAFGVSLFPSLFFFEGLRKKVS